MSSPEWLRNLYRPLARDANSLWLTGTPVPIVYGTARVTANIIEREEPINLAWNTLPDRQMNHAYALGAIVNCYFNQNGIMARRPYPSLCVVAGTTGSAVDLPNPAAIPGTVTDGGVTWNVMDAGWKQSTVYGLCEGQIAGTVMAWQDRQRYPSANDVPHNSTWLAIMDGASVQSRPSWSVGDKTYGNTACLYLDNHTGADSGAPSVDVEVRGLFAYPNDAHPADILTDLLTHSRRGAGWPTSRVDAAGLAQWRTYCNAVGLKMSWLIDAQASAVSLVSQLLEAANASAVWSGGALKGCPPVRRIGGSVHAQHHPGLRPGGRRSARGVPDVTAQRRRVLQRGPSGVHAP